MAKWSKTNREEYNKTRREWYKKNAEKERSRLKVSNTKRRLEARSWIRDYKKSKGCCKCPENDPVCLDFHHNNGDKTNNIGTIWDCWSRDRLQKEIDKCIIICANCHRKLHWNKDKSL